MFLLNKIFNKTFSRAKSGVRKSWLLAEAMILLGGPPALAVVGVIPHAYRWLPASLVLILMFWRIIVEKWSLGQLGFRTIEFKHAVYHHVNFTIFSLSGLFLAVYWIAPDFVPSRSITMAFVMTSLLVSFLQELLFRTFLIETMERAGFRSFTIVLTSAFTFAFIHTFFQNFMWLMIGLCFVYGLVMAILYIRYRNLLLATLSHFAVNLAGLYVGLF